MSNRTLPIRYFRLVKGTHYDDQERVYVATDPKRNVVKSYQDLTKIFKNKFEEITERVALEKELASKEKITREVVAQSRGRDVTTKFRKAVKHKLQVFRIRTDEGRRYNVIDPELDKNKPLNRKPLEKEAVSDFVELQTA